MKFLVHMMLSSILIGSLAFSQQSSEGGHQTSANPEAPANLPSNPLVTRMIEVKAELKTTLEEASKTGFDAERFLRTHAENPIQTPAAFGASEPSGDHQAKLVSLFNEYRSLHRVLHAPHIEDKAMVAQLLSEIADSESRAAAEGNAGGEQNKEKKNPDDANRLAQQQRAAQKAADINQKIRDLEQSLAKKDQQDSARQNGSGNGGSGQGNSGQGNGNSSGQGFAPNSSNNQNSVSNDSLNQFANKLGNALGQQGFSNFSNFSNSNKKDEEKKPSFSIEPSKNSSNPFSLDNPSKPKPSNLTNLAGMNLPEMSSASTPWTGTTQPLSQEQWGTSSSGNAVANSSGNQNPIGGNGMNGMMGGMGMGMGMGMKGSSSALASLGSNDSFPFNVTGEPGGNAEDDGWPWFTVVSVPMSSSSGGDGSGSSESGSSAQESSNNNLAAKGTKGVPQYLYLMNHEEASLKGVPGIFRSLAASYKKTRIQNLCSQIATQKVGICQRMRNKTTVFTENESES